MLDDRFTRTPADANPLNLGGTNTLNQWPQSPSWQFVAVGRGHGVEDFWVPFLQALHAIDPDMAVNIEHEDTELDQIEGLRLAAENLIAAARTAGRLMNGDPPVRTPRSPAGPPVSGAAAPRRTTSPQSTVVPSSQTS